MRCPGPGALVAATALFTLCVLLCPAMLIARTPREVTSLDANWRFHRGDLSAPGIGRPIAAWRWKAEPRGETSAAEMSAAELKTDGADWKDTAPGDDVFHGRRGFAWFRTTLPAGTAEQPKLFFESVDDNAVVYLNGKLLKRHQGWDDPFSVPLAEAWRKEGPNVLAVLVENTAGAGGIGPVAFEGLADETPPAQSPLNPAYDDSAWQRVDVPHDYIVEGTFSERANKDHGFLPVEPGWYRKAIAIPATDKGRRLWLEFDGVFRNSRMWLNGKYLGSHPSGYGSFRYDITDAVQPGKDNLLTVRVDPGSFEGWWYEGGGIYRHVRLVSVEPVHIAPNGVFVATNVTDVGDGVRAVDASLTVRTRIINESGARVHLTLRSERYDADGHLQGLAETDFDSRGDRELHQANNLSLIRAYLWSLENPYLYTLRTTLSVDGKVVDQVTTPFGVRTIRFDADKGFFLNGKPVKLKGTCNHQDFAGVGIAVPDRILEWRIQKLKEMGSNAYRCSHNPVAAELLDACDRLGMLVMDETRHLGDTYSGKSPPTTPYSDLSDLSEMVLRDRNHPSIIMWSICNEEGIQGSAAGARIGKAMKDRVNSLDGTRPVSAAMNGGHGGSGLTTVLDLEGYNYSPADYAGFHKKYRQKPMYGSETASAVSSRGIYANDKAKGYVSAYDVNAPPWALPAEKAWRPIAENDYMAGCFVWTGFDYRGEPTPYGWPCINSHFGIMDMCGFPKDSYYYYQAWWSDKPVLHIFPHWNWPGKEGQEIEVWCHSNCQRVELFLNGDSLGAQEMKPNGHLVWKVKYQPGTLLARGVRDGKELTDKVETTSAPAAIELTPEQSKVAADGADVSLVTVRILDDKGRLVEIADDEVSFSIRGPGKIIGVGNGDPSSHEPDKATKRHAFNGLCMAVIQSTTEPGEIELSATAPGLKPASVKIHADRPSAALQ